MDPRSNSNPGTGLPQPGDDMGQLPPIHAPQSFHAPDISAAHFDTSAPQLGAVAPTPQQVPMPQQPESPQPPAAAAPTVSSQSQQPAQPPAATTPQDIAAAMPAGPVDDDDTAFDEEWVNKAREVVGRTKADPFAQSHELSKLKAQYIKLRYNKDVKVSE